MIMTNLESKMSKYIQDNLSYIKILLCMGKNWKEICQNDNDG